MQNQSPKQKKIKNKERVLWAALVVGLLAWNVLGGQKPLEANVEISHKYQQVLQNVFFFLQQTFVEEVNEKDLLIGAVRGMLASTGDPYTRFLDRSENEDFANQEGGRMAGIGVEVTIQGGYPVIIAPIEGGPAEKAGLLASDRIVGVDGKSVENMDFAEILNKIGGDVGTIVEIEIAREGVRENKTYPIKRSFFSLDYCRGETLAKDQVGYLRLSHFFGEDAGTVEEFRDLLKGFVKKGTKGIIVDLRNNPGGHLEMAGTLTGYFLKEGQVVVRARGRGNENNREIRAQGETNLVPENIKVVVLINKGSASASEIFSGALQDHKRATLIGTKSFGKASVQQKFGPFPDNTAALITIQKYYTPNDRSIHGKGLDPDIFVDDVRPDVDESYFLYKMEQEKYLASFKAKNKTYSQATVDAYLKGIITKGWHLRREVAEILLRREYGIFDRNPDPKVDPQLRAALEVILGLK